MFSGEGSALSTFGFCSRPDETACSNPPVSFWMIVFRSGDCIIRAETVKVKSPFPAAGHSFILWFSLFPRLNRYRASPLRTILWNFLCAKKLSSFKPNISRSKYLSILGIWGFAPSLHQRAFRTFTAPVGASPFGNLRAQIPSCTLEISVLLA